MKMIFYSLAILIASTLLSSPAEARSGACTREILDHCSTVEPGGGRIYQCLMKHSAELSPGCKEILQKWLESHPQEVQGQGQKGNGALQTGKNNQGSSTTPQ